jgi:hypothetical protein
MAMLLAGQLPSEVAAATKVPERTVREWRDKDPEFAVYREKRPERMEATILALFEEYTEGLRLAIRTCTQPDYVKEQDAASMATLLGVVTDKVFAIVNAVYAARRPDVVDE